VIQHDLTPVETDIETIYPHPRNPHNGDVEAIKRSIAKNGVYAPVVIQKSTRFVVKGNHTYEALMDLGFPTLPVVTLDIDDDRALRILLTDNRISQRGNDDPGLLKTLPVSSYEFVISRFDEKPLTARDFNRVRKGLGGIPLSKADLQQQGVPAWEK